MWRHDITIIVVVVVVISLAMLSDISFARRWWCCCCCGVVRQQRRRRRTPQPLHSTTALKSRSVGHPCRAVKQRPYVRRYRRFALTLECRGLEAHAVGCPGCCCLIDCVAVVGCSPSTRLPHHLMLLCIHFHIRMWSSEPYQLNTLE